MNLEYLEPKLTPESWEELIDNCYRLRYEKEHYQKIPSNFGGDGGIEGFTRSGIVYQCYYPEKNYSDNELYEHLRDKVTDDINKLVDIDNICRLKKLGVVSIKEWHFVIPYYKDSRILQHIQNKKYYVLELKKSKPMAYNLIDKEFDIIIKIADDFICEISKLIIKKNETKISVASQGPNIDLSQCESEKVKNVKRKLKAITDKDESDADFVKMLNMYLTFYMRGVQIMNDMRHDFPAAHEELFSLINIYRMEIVTKTLMNPQPSLNYKLFNQIMDEFEDKLKTFTFLTPASITELKMDVIAGWLADCSMEFRV